MSSHWIWQRNMALEWTRTDSTLPCQDRGRRARSARADNSYMDEKSAFYKAALGDSVSEFVGYTTLNTDSVITVLIDKTGSVDVLSEGQEGEIVLNVTPFYASSGGQINDEGYIKGTDGALAQVLSVSDPLKTAKVHTVKVVKGQFRVKDTVSAEVDESRRNNIRRNHSATHLIHAALRQVLGDHIQQAGSLVEPERLRFDFTHFKAMSYDEKKAVERLANSWIIENLPVETVVTNVSEAKAKGCYGTVRREVRRRGQDGLHGRPQPRTLWRNSRVEDR